MGDIPGHIMHGRFLLSSKLANLACAVARNTESNSVSRIRQTIDASSIICVTTRQNIYPPFLLAYVPAPNDHPRHQDRRRSMCRLVKYSIIHADLLLQSNPQSLGWSSHEMYKSVALQHRRYSSQHANECDHPLSTNPCRLAAVNDGGPENRSPS